LGLEKSKYVPFHAQDKNGYDDNIYGGTGVLSGQYVSVECTEDDEETQNNGVLNSSHSMYGGFQKPSFSKYLFFVYEGFNRVGSIMVSCR
jgi:hypothetical protein